MKYSIKVPEIAGAILIGIAIIFMVTILISQISKAKQAKKNRNPYVSKIRQTQEQLGRRVKK